MKVAVIGAGPMGLVSSIAIKKFNPDFEVVLFEKNNDIGPRIKVSGNGRCNFNNVNVAVDKYNTAVIKDILDCNEDVFKLLEETGFMHYADNEGRCYPISETSVTLLNVFKILLEKYKVEVRLEKEISNIEFEGKLISIYGEKFDRLVLGIGGISSYNDRLCYEKLMSTLPVNLTELTPSLAPLSTSSFPKGLENRRVKCEVSLLCKGRIVKREKGEVLFKNSGLSGIVIFNMTSYLSRHHLKDYKDYQISLNLLPNCSKEQVNELVKNKINLHAVLLDQLASYIEQSSYQVEMLTDLRFNIKGIYDFENSQVTSGGISLQDINKDLSLRRNPRIYVGGEEIDVDGECGGYNIAFAMCSGYYIGKNIK